MRAIGTGCDQRVGGAGLETYTRLGAKFVGRTGVARTAVPALVNPGARPIDRRPLGAHFLGFTYHR